MARFEIEIPITHIQALENMAATDSRTRKNYCEVELVRLIEARSEKKGGKWVLKPKTT